MIVSYDSSTDAVYIKIKPKTKVYKTVEFASEAFVDLDKSGNLVGVELLSPVQLILKRISKRFHRPELAKIDPAKLYQSVHS